MTEKSIAAQNYRFTYVGPFPIQDFFDTIDKWASDHHYHKEIKEHSERMGQGGKEIRYSIELWTHQNTQIVGMVRMSAMMGKLKDAVVTRNGRKEKVQRAEVYINIDGLVERHLAHRWDNKPTIFFIRSVIDRFISKNVFEQGEGEVAIDTKDFFNHMKAFFNSQQSKRA